MMLVAQSVVVVGVAKARALDPHHAMSTRSSLVVDNPRTITSASTTTNKAIGLGIIIASPKARTTLCKLKKTQSPWCSLPKPMSSPMCHHHREPPCLYHRSIASHHVLLRGRSSCSSMVKSSLTISSIISSKASNHMLGYQDALTNIDTMIHDNIKFSDGLEVVIEGFNTMLFKGKTDEHLSLMWVYLKGQPPTSLALVCLMRTNVTSTPSMITTRSA